MAIITYPLNGIKYSAEDAETYLCTRTTGVYASSGHYDVSIIGDRTITISKGLAWMHDGEMVGKSLYNKTEESIIIPIASGSLNRKDRVVIRFDKGLNESKIVLKIGTLSNNPKPPDIVRDGIIFEIGLYIIDVQMGSTIVKMSDITDTRLDENVCGIMRDAVTGLPTAQIQRQAEDLIENLRKMGEDAAGGAIPDHSITIKKLASDTASTIIYPAESSYSKPIWTLSGDFPLKGIYMIRFTSSNNYVQGDTISINGTGYTLSMTNGKPLGNNAWVSGAVVCLQVNPTEKKAFFSGGGADLSFITAGANQIMSGFVGANKDGEPVAGTRTARVQKIAIGEQNVTMVDDGGSGTKYFFAQIACKVPTPFDLLVMVGRVGVKYEVFEQATGGGYYWSPKQEYSKLAIVYDNKKGQFLANAQQTNSAEVPKDGPFEGFSIDIIEDFNQFKTLQYNRNTNTLIYSFQIWRVDNGPSPKDLKLTFSDCALYAIKL